MKLVHDAETNTAVLAILAGIAAILFLMRHQIQKGLEDFWNNFPRGGPPTPPTHPLPAGDSALLRRRRSKKVPATG